MTPGFCLKCGGGWRHRLGCPEVRAVMAAALAAQKEALSCGCPSPQPEDFEAGAKKIQGSGGHSAQESSAPADHRGRLDRAAPPNDYPGLCPICGGLLNRGGAHGAGFCAPEVDLTGERATATRKWYEQALRVAQPAGATAELDALFAMLAFKERWLAELFSECDAEV